VGDPARADLGELAFHLLEAGGKRAGAVADRLDQGAHGALKASNEPVELRLDRVRALEQLRGGLLDSLHVGSGLRPRPLAGRAGVVVGAAPDLVRLALHLQSDFSGAALGSLDDATHLLGRRSGHGGGVASRGGALQFLDPVGDLPEVVVDLDRVVPPSGRREVRPLNEPPLQLQATLPDYSRIRR
jgi:hypothetical protein